MELMDVADMTRRLAKIAFEYQSVGLISNPLPKTVFNGYTFLMYRTRLSNMGNKENYGRNCFNACHQL